MYEAKFYDADAFMSYKHSRPSAKLSKRIGSDTLNYNFQFLLLSFRFRNFA